MATITVTRDNRVFRWAGGSFVGVWEADRADEHVPDDMINLPGWLNRSKAEQDDIDRIVSDWLKAQQAERIWLQAIDEVIDSGTPMTISRPGGRAAVIVPLEEWEMLQKFIREHVGIKLESATPRRVRFCQICHLLIVELYGCWVTEGNANVANGLEWCGDPEQHQRHKPTRKIPQK